MIFCKTSITPVEKFGSMLNSGSSILHSAIQKNLFIDRVSFVVIVYLLLMFR